MRARIVAIAIAAAALGAACGGIGGEDVQLLPEAGAASDDGGRACVPNGNGDTHPCIENGAACSANAECCSLRCADGVCLQAGTCNGPGTPCSSRDQCCSGRCEPVAGTTNRACLDYCVADGQKCTLALDCCSMDCHGGVCGGAFCGTGESATCATNADCCGGACSNDDKTCSTDSRPVCRAAGESCGSGAGTPCCGACDATSQRCGFGPGPCLATGSICTQDTDCCRGTCTMGSTGVRVCTAPCLADGTACSTGAECCNRHCNGAPGKCGGAVTCGGIGATCRTDGECCSGQCLNGSCGSNCQAP